MKTIVALSGTGSGEVTGTFMVVLQPVKNMLIKSNNLIFIFLFFTLYRLCCINKDYLIELIEKHHILAEK